MCHEEIIIFDKVKYWIKNNTKNQTFLYHIFIYFFKTKTTLDDQKIFLNGTLS